MSKTVKNLASISLALTTAVWLAGAGAFVPAAQAAALTDDQINSILTLLRSFGADATTINNVQSSLMGKPVTTATAQTTTTACNFTRNLTMGATGDDVKCLQQFLNGAGVKIAESGAGSPGNESTYFGSLTKTAVMKWQDMNAARVLTPVGLTKGTGFWGPGSIAYYKTVAGAVAPVAGGTPPPPPSGTTVPVATVPAGTDLLVQKASDTPGEKTIGSGTAFNPSLKVNLSAGAKDVVINSVTLKKEGFLANTNINGVDVVDSKGTRHGNVVSSVNSDNTVLLTMSSDPIKVMAGTGETLLFRFNLAVGNYTGSLAFTVQAVGADTTNVSGLPITGATMNILNGGTSLASSTFSARADVGSSTLNVDANSLQDITKFRIVEASSNEGLNFYGLTVYNYGSAGDADYKDVTLVDQGGVTIATAQPVGNTVVFKLAAPYFIDKGQTKDFTVKAKLVGGTNRTIRLAVINDYDVDIRGSATGVAIIPTATGNGETSFPVGDTMNLQTIGTGSMTFSRATDSPSAAVTPGATGILLAKFNVVPTGEDQELRQVSFYIATSAAGIDLTGTVYVKVNGATVYSAAASSISNTAATTYTLTSYPVLKAGEVSVIEVIGDVDSSAGSNASYTVTDFDLIQVKRLTTKDIVDPGVGVISGYQRSVSAATLAVTTLATPVADSVVTGNNQYTFAVIQLNAGSGGEDVNVTRIIVTDTLGSGTDYSGVSGLLMYKEGETSPLVTTASTATNANTVTFTFQNPVTVTRSQPVTLYLKGNVIATTGTSHRYNVASSSGNVVAVGKSSGNTLTHGSSITFDGNGQAQTVVSSGNLLMSLAGGPAVNQVIKVGSTDMTALIVKFTSQYEEQKITSLTLTATTSVANGLATTTVKNIRVYEGSNLVAQKPQFDTCTANGCTVTITASDNIFSQPISKTGTIVTVKVDIGLPGAGRLGDNFRFMIASSTGDVAIKGSVSGLTTGTKTGTPTAVGYSYIVPHIVTISGVEPTAAANVSTGTGLKVAVFKVDNGVGNPTIELASTTQTFTQSQTASTSVTFNMDASVDGGGQSDVSQWAAAGEATSTTGTTGASSSIEFNLVGLSAAQRQITTHRYLTIRTVGGSANNDGYQFSVSTLGNITFNIDEGVWGHDGNLDGSVGGFVTGLYVNGLPSLPALTAKT